MSALSVGAVIRKFVAFSLALLLTPLAVFYALHSSGLNLLGSFGFHASSSFQADVVSAVAAIVALNVVIVAYVASAMSEANAFEPTLRKDD